jgi:predicted nucleic acid-binding protein
MLALDTSALVKRYVDETHSEWLAEAMDGDPEWHGSMLVACEGPIVLGRSTSSAEELASIDRHLTADLDRFRFVQIDGDCLTDAVHIGRSFRLRTLDAIHLAAARRLPAECRFITFDQSQARAAVEIGLELLAPPVV